MQLLTFIMNGIPYGVPVTNVESIETQKTVIHIPGAPANVQGIMNLHGEIIAVYSLASRFGYGNIACDNIIVVRLNETKIGLQVQDVQNIVDVENKNILPMPVIMNATQHCLNDVASVQKELVALLDVTRLLTKEELHGIEKLVEENSEQTDKVSS